MKKTKFPGVYRLADGRYQLRVTGRCPKTGYKKNLKKTITAPGAAEASRQRESLRAELRRGEAERRVERMRVNSVAASWLRQKTPTLKPASSERYANALVHFLTDYGDFFLDQLTASDVVAWRDSQRGSKPATVNGRLRVIKAMLADVSYEYKIRNPAERTKSLREPRRSLEHRVLTPDELRRLLDTIEAELAPWHAMFATFAFTGMRAGEVAALRWRNVDLHQRSIRVCESRWKQKIGSTKTDRVRSVAIGAQLTEILAMHRRSQLRAQAPGIERGLVFPSKAGTYITNATISAKLRKALALAGIEKRFTSHGFRYTFNSLMRSQAPDHVVRSMTGHATERMTEHYTSVGHDEKRRAVVNFESLISSKVSREVSFEDAPTKTTGEASASTGRNL